MAVVLIAPANTATRRWISAVRIAPTAALLKYGRDVGNFKNNPQRYLSCQAAKKPLCGDRALPCPAINCRKKKHVRVNRPRVQTLITRYMLTVT